MQGNTENSATTAASGGYSSPCSSVTGVTEAGESGSGASRSGGEWGDENANDDEMPNEDWLIDSMVVGDGTKVGNFTLQEGI